MINNKNINKFSNNNNNNNNTLIKMGKLIKKVVIINKDNENMYELISNLIKNG